MAEYRRGNFDFVIDSNFTPFTLQEMLVPFSAYKDVYEQTEAAYEDLAQKSDVFKSLSKDLPEGSLASKIYKGYADELHARAAQLATEGLSMGNRRALANLKRRYQGEIGRLVSAKEAMDKYKELRLARNMQDSSMLYATEDNALNIDSFLDGKTPNLYGISGNELYARGAQAAKSYSSRIFKEGDAKDIIDGYYKEWVEENGMSPESMDAFYQDMSKVPELQRLAEGILKEKGVYKNLRGDAFESAKQSVINGIVDGAIYTRKVTPVRNPGKMDAYQAAQIRLSEEQNRIARARLALAAAGGGGGGGKGKGSKSGKSGGRVPGYGSTKFYGKNGGVVEVKDIDGRARKVQIQKDEGGGYRALIDGKVVAYTDINGKAKLNVENVGGDYDFTGKAILKSLTPILEDAHNIERREGSYGVENYDYYALPSVKDPSNETFAPEGGFYRQPLIRYLPTIWNTDESYYSTGEDGEDVGYDDY